MFLFEMSKKNMMQTAVSCVFNKAIQLTAVFLASLGLLMLSATPASAESPIDWPKHELRLIVPFGAGSTPDQIARVVAASAGQELKQTIVVENRIGAGGNIGTGIIVHAKPDGYTFGITINGPLVYNQFLYKLNYDPEVDLAPLTLAVTQPNVLVVNKDSGITTLSQLVEKIKAKPNVLNFAIPGTGSGSHLSMELLLDKIGGKAVSIPYTSSPQALNSLLAGDTQFTALAPIAVVPLANDGRLNILAQTGKDRIEALGDIPTIKETGVADIDSSAWSGFVISAKVAPEIREKLQKALFNALHDPDVVSTLKAQYMQPIPSTPQEFSSYIQEEKTRWEPLIKSLKLQLN